MRGWGSPGIGLYVKYYLQISLTSDVVCFEPIYTKRWYRIILSRDLKGVVKLYLDGYLCAAGKPKASKGYTLKARCVLFFHGGILR